MRVTAVFLPNSHQEKQFTSTLTITSKGQVTIPKAVREALSLFAGDTVEFVLTDSDEALMRPVAKRVDNVYGRLYDSTRTAVSIKEMNTAVKERAQASIEI